MAENSKIAPLTDGNSLADGTDLNTLTSTASILLYGTYSNAPISTSFAGLMTVNRCSTDGNWIVQTITQHDADRIWVRTRKGTWTAWAELALNSNIPGKIKGGNVASFYAILANNLGQVLDKLESEIANRDGGIIQNISTGSAAYGILLFKLNNNFWSGIITSYAMNGVVYSFSYNNGNRYLSAVNIAW